MAAAEHSQAKFRHLPMLAALAALVALGSVCGESLASRPRPPLEHNPAIARPDEQIAEATPSVAAAVTTPNPPATLTLIGVGDMMLARTIGQRIVAVGPQVVFDERMMETLRGADLTVGNLETAVSERGEAQAKGYTFRAPPAALDALELAGFDAVSLANNHSLDFGVDGLLDAGRLLSIRGIAAVGAGANIAKAVEPKVLVRAGLRVAFVGLVDVGEEGPGFSRRTWEATAGRPGVAWADLATVRASVKNAAADADIVVVMLHFGTEFETEPSLAQRELARAAIDAGALLVIGSHPHVLQEVEEYGGGLIAYSLGNFVFDGFDGRSNDSALLRVTMGRGGVQSWELIPVAIVDNGFPRLARP